MAVRKMRILHVATGFPITFPGGITNYVRSLARQQRKDGHYVGVVCGPGVDRGAPFVTEVDEITELPSAMSVFSLSIARECESVSQALRDKIEESFDVVHFHMTYGVPLSFHESRISQLRYVVSLHDYGYICPRIFMVDKWGNLCRVRELSKCKSCVGALEQVDILRAGFNRLNWRLPTIGSDAVNLRSDVMQGFLLRADAVLAVSSKVAEIVDNALGRSVSQVVHIGNDSADTPRKSRRWTDSEGRVRICYLGTLNKSKGAELFIEFVRSLRSAGCTFSFFGRGEEAFLTQLKELGVHIGGAYKPADLANILEHVDLGFVLPVWNDNGPQVLMEFLNHGIPVLGTKMGGIPDFLSEECGYLMDPFDPAAFTASIAWIRQLDAMRLAQLASSIRRLQTPYQHACKIEQIYQSIRSKDAFEENGIGKERAVL